MEAPEGHRFCVEIVGIVKLEEVGKHIDLILNGSEPSPPTCDNHGHFQCQRVNIGEDDDIYDNCLLIVEAIVIFKVWQHEI